MQLRELLSDRDLILGVAERTRNKFPSVHQKCELLSIELVKSLKQEGIRAIHVVGNFHLDEPGANKWPSSIDDYVVNHDWVKVDGKILDITADQFQPYVYEFIPKVVFAGYADPIVNYYEELRYA